MREVLDLDKSLYQNWRDVNRDHWDDSDIPAIDYFGNQMTFAEADAEMDRYARAFKNLQTDQDSSVTFCVPTVPSTMNGLYGLNKAGIQANFVGDTMLADDGPTYLDRPNAETVVVLDAFYPRVAEQIARTSVKNLVIVSFADNVVDVPPQLPDQLKRVLDPEDHSAMKAIKSRAMPGIELFSISDLLGGGASQSDCLEAVYQPDRTSVLLYTGGSTGTPKGIEKTDRELVAMGEVYDDPALGLNLQPGERNGIFIPGNHPTGLVNSAIAQWFFGTTQVPQPFYNRLTFPDDVYGLNLNIAVAAPSHFAMFPQANLPDGALRNLRLAICGGEPVSPELFENINRAMVDRFGAQNPLTVCYGMSELGPLTHMTLGHRTYRPVPGVKSRLIDSEGKEVIGAGSGKLEVSAPKTQMKGYFKQPELVQESQTADGYWKTGDYAKRDTDGYEEVLGRANDSFADANGEIHYLFSIEQFIDKDPAVLEVEAQALTVSGGQQLPAAYLALKDGDNEFRADVIKRLHDKCLELPPEERPVGYYLLHKFGTNPVSHKREYQSLPSIRSGYYNYDEAGQLYEVSFPEYGDPIKQPIDAGDIIVH
ncbi:acyl--CoA ligase [Candidatus Saccharibacteria bacterium]|nr:acyl--CoA ligase [Candidatus Saccharibacteria bacterium]